MSALIIRRDSNQSILSLRSNQHHLQMIPNPVEKCICVNDVKVSKFWERNFVNFSVMLLYTLRSKSGHTTTTYQFLGK